MTREPEWDDVQREAMLGLLVYQGGICSGCGFHHDLTSDKSNQFPIEERTCNVCRGLAPYLRAQQAADAKAVEALGDKPNPLAPRPSDGRTLSIRYASQLEIEARRARSALPRADA